MPPKKSNRREEVDDGHNMWGIFMWKIQKNPYHLLRPSLRIRTSCDEIFYYNRIKDILESLFPGYELLRLESSGGAANAFALMDACGYDLSKAAVAIGSYATGANSYMSPITTPIKLTENDSWCSDIPSFDKQICSVTGISRVCLPYFAPSLLGDSNEHILDLAEEHAIDELRHVFQSRSIQALLLEVVQALTGLQLRSIFLQKLEDLATEFGVRIVIDDILTFGRLPLRSARFEMKYPSYITLGKWLNTGVVLCRKGIARVSNPVNRGDTVSFHLKPACDILEHVLTIWDEIPNLVSSARRRALEHLQHHLGENETLISWGEGAIVFSDAYCAKPSVILGRFLPHLECKLMNYLWCSDVTGNIQMHKSEYLKEYYSTIMFKHLNFLIPSERIQ